MTIAGTPVVTSGAATALAVVLAAGLGAGWATLGVKARAFRHRPAQWLPSRWLWSVGFWSGLLTTLALAGWGLQGIAWTSPTCFDLSFRPCKDPAQCVPRALPLLHLGTHLALLFHLATLRVVAGVVLREPWDRRRLTTMVAAAITLAALGGVGWVYQPATSGIDTAMAKPWYGGLLGDGFTAEAVIALALGSLLATIYWIHRQTRSQSAHGSHCCEHD